MSLLRKLHHFFSVLWQESQSKLASLANAISFFSADLDLLSHLGYGNRVRARQILLKSHRVGRSPGVSCHLYSNGAGGEESICLPSHVLHHHLELVTTTHLWIQSGGSWETVDQKVTISKQVRNRHTCEHQIIPVDANGTCGTSDKNQIVSTIQRYTVYSM